MPKGILILQVKEIWNIKDSLTLNINKIITVIHRFRALRAS